ncbi:tetraspanin 35 [Synchiropus splendidus]|uniref:tetraspanin 35 n=1 Tax=Synchiropus splendidus TaxID=270530 RepID=UPI00237EB77F|nr:tetraspanin 35 [Synchiropus splendidus]
MGCFGFLKFMMFVFNGIIFLAGAAILGVGIWVKVDSSSIFDLLGKVKNLPPELSQVLHVGYLLIAIGALLLLIGFLGCCGAVKESRCMLLLFFIIVLVVFIAEVVGAIIILVFRPLAGDLLAQIGAAAVKNIRKDYGKNPDITILWNTTMSAMSCCGFYNASDFLGSPYYSGNDNKYPPLCCSHSADNPCNQSMAETSPVPGCFSKFTGMIESNTGAIVAVALAIAALEVCAMIVSMVLYCQVKSR